MLRNPLRTLQVGFARGANIAMGTDPLKSGFLISSKQRSPEGDGIPKRGLCSSPLAPEGYKKC
jgi:hypothetical protein